MEIEENRPTSDADRRLAEAKKLTIQPVHANIIPDNPSDTAIGTKHLTEPAIANTTNDTEADASFIHPTKSFLNRQPNSAKPQTHKLIISLIICGALFVSLTIVAFLK